MSDGKSNINNSNNTRIHSSRIRIVRSPTVHALVAIYEMSTPGEGGPQVNKFEHVSGLGHQMPVPGEVPVRWEGSGQGDPVQRGDQANAGRVVCMELSNASTVNRQTDTRLRTFPYHKFVGKYVFTPERWGLSMWKLLQQSVFWKQRRSALPPVAGPGFPRRGAPNPNGRAHVLFGQILQKTASKNEENWTQTQGASKILLCRSANGHWNMHFSFKGTFHSVGNRVRDLNVLFPYRSAGAVTEHTAASILHARHRGHWRLSLMHPWRHLHCKEVGRRVYIQFFKNMKKEVAYVWRSHAGL